MTCHKPFPQIIGAYQTETRTNELSNPLNLYSLKDSFLIFSTPSYNHSIAFIQNNHPE